MVVVGEDAPGVAAGFGVRAAEWVRRYPRYPHAISDALRALQRGEFVLNGLKVGRSGGFEQFELLRRLSCLGGLQPLEGAAARRLPKLRLQRPYTSRMDGGPPTHPPGQ